jgi:hypothetical protein
MNTTCCDREWRLDFAQFIEDEKKKISPDHAGRELEKTGRDWRMNSGNCRRTVMSRYDDENGGANHVAVEKARNLFRDSLIAGIQSSLSFMVGNHNKAD